MDTLVVDPVIQDVIGKNLCYDNEYLDIDLIAEYLQNDKTCLPEETIPAIAYSRPIQSAPSHHLHVNNISNIPTSSTSSPPHVTTPSYNHMRTQALLNGQNHCYDNPVMHPTLPDSPPDSEPYSPPDGHHNHNNHNIVTTQDNYYCINTPHSTRHDGDVRKPSYIVTVSCGGNQSTQRKPPTCQNKYGVNPTMHHMYPPSHHRPPGIHSKSMPPGYNEPPVLNHMPPAPVSHPDPSTSTPIPLSASGMNQMISPQHSIAPHPSQKKRKYSDSPNNTLTNVLLNGRHDMLNIKQEPTSSSFGGYIGDCEDDYHYDPDSSNSGFMDSSYQVIKWQPFNIPKWTALTDSNLKDLPPPQYRIDSDKGFNFSTPDEAFVCQKKNHFQVTAHMAIAGDPRYVRTPEGVKKIDAFYLHFYGVKVESQTQSIKIEQSQSDRSKKAFHPVRVDLIPNQTNKMTVGRLHFSETTSNNMRKKGRPNPDQRYFMLVVALHAHCGDNDYMVAANSSERLIVRASNPGQFDSDVDVMWQKAQTPDGVYHVGRVGVNTDHPEEALTVHGNMRLTGHLLQPSDKRVKDDIKEINSKEQLKNVSQLNIYKYKYKQDFADSVGLPENQRHDTGVLAQEVQTVLPDAVMETGNVALNSGKNVNNLLVVNKDRIFMENVGAVKELCKLTDNLEVRIDELEKMNKKLSKLKRYDSLKSTVSSKSGCSVSTVSSTPPPKKSSLSSPSHKYHHHHHHQSSHHHSNRKTALPPTDGGWCSNRFIQIVIITLILIMAFCLVAITVLYILERHNKHSHQTTLSPSVNNALSQPQGATTSHPKTTITTTPSHLSPLVNNPTTQRPSTTTRAVIQTLPVIEFRSDCHFPGRCESFCCPPPNQDDGTIIYHRPIIINPFDNNNNNQPDVVVDNNNTEMNESHENTGNKLDNELPGDDKTTTKKPEDNNIIVVINNSNQPQPGYSNVGNINTNEVQNTFFNRRRRRKRNADLEDLHADIRLKETNTTIDNTFCDPQTPNACSDRNYTYTILFSHFWGLSQSFTVMFSTSLNNEVHLCLNHTRQQCNHDHFNEIDSSVAYQWKIPITHFFYSSYTFRVATKGIPDVCALPPGNIFQFAEYTLIFNRQCNL